MACACGIKALCAEHQVIRACCAHADATLSPALNARKNKPWKHHSDAVNLVALKRKLFSGLRILVGQDRDMSSAQPGQTRDSLLVRHGR